MFWIITLTVIAVICFIAACLIKVPQTQADSFKPSRTKKKPVLKMLNCEGDPHEDEWHTYIAGVNHHASKYDIGGFSGWVAPDPENTHDNKAMGIYGALNKTGLLLGYIPAKELSDYREWCDAQPQPCVGFIFVEDGQMRGRVKILRPCNEEFLEKEFTRYLQWVNDNYGAEYLPKSMNMQFDIDQNQ